MTKPTLTTTFHSMNIQKMFLITFALYSIVLIVPEIGVQSVAALVWLGVTALFGAFIFCFLLTGIEHLYRIRAFRRNAPQEQ